MWPQPAKYNIRLAGHGLETRGVPPNDTGMPAG